MYQKLLADGYNNLNVGRGLGREHDVVAVHRASLGHGGCAIRFGNRDSRRVVVRNANGHVGHAETAVVGVLAADEVADEAGVQPLVHVVVNRGNSDNLRYKPVGFRED